MDKLNKIASIVIIFSILILFLYYILMENNKNNKNWAVNFPEDTEVEMVKLGDGEVYVSKKVLLKSDESFLFQLVIIRSVDSTDKNILQYKYSCPRPGWWVREIEHDGLLPGPPNRPESFPNILNTIFKVHDTAKIVVEIKFTLCQNGDFFHLYINGDEKIWRFEDQIESQKYAELLNY